MGDPIGPFTLAVEALLRDKKDMEDAIKESFLQVKLAAKFLVGENNRDAQERNPAFLQQQKQALQEAAKKLVDEERGANRWSTALQEMRNDAGLRQQLTDATQVEAKLPDFQQVFLKKLDALAKSASTSYDQNPMYKEVMKILGNSQEEEEEDELQVMATQGDEERSLKCPITAQLLVDPVTALCSHSFSKAAILQYIRTKASNKPNSPHPGAVACPIYGCSGLIKASDLKADAEKAHLLKRHARSQQQRMTQDDDADDYEDAEIVDD